MTDNERKKLEAAGKIAFGTLRVASGVVTGCGYGLIGAMCRSHHHMLTAHGIAKRSIEAGAETFNEGLAEWKDASA